MSKINAVRLINLNYNNNSIRISDDIFQMQGKSTLMSLQNGGGKSVLVQMISAPFVHKRYRDAKDRPFESYFTTNKPTFIMIEWKLDRGAGYCLTGMMVRKSQLSEEDNDNPLEIVNFICEYSNRCEQDIYHLPVVEKNKKEIVLKSFRECRQLFETYKKDHSIKFYFYDMNNSAQSRQYFDKLAEYQIYYKEWENIIKKVNLKESGLSELFADCRDEKGLIEKWFLDAVESKLNREKDRMKEFQNIIEKYVISYKANKSKIERRNTIQQFQEDAAEIRMVADEYQLVTNRLEEQENRIAGFRDMVQRMEEEQNTVKNSLLEQKTAYEQELAHIEYEKYSYEILKRMEEMNYHVSNRDMIGMEKDVLEEELLQIETLLHKMELAKHQEQVEEIRQEESLLRERLKVLRVDESKLEPERKALGKALAYFYEGLLSDLSLQGKQQESARQEENEKICELQDRDKEYEEIIIHLIRSISTYKERMKGFDRSEDNFNREFGERFARNIMREYEPGFLEIKKEEYQKELEETVRSCTAHRKQLEEANERQKSLLRDIDDKQRERICKQHEISDLEKEKAEYDRELSERQTILRYFGMDAKEQWNTEKILVSADRKLAECEQAKRILEKEEDELQKEFVRLTQGKVLELPGELEVLFEKLNINIVYGMDWLKRNGYSQRENEALVRRQPFLPYALILTKQDMKILSEHDKEIYTSFPIPIISREKLEDAILEKESGLLALEGISFFVWFNEKLLDEEALRLLVQEKEQQIREKKEQTAVRKREYEEYFEKKERLRNQKVTKELYDKNKTRMSELFMETEELDKSILSLKSEAQKNEELVQELTEDIVNEQHEIDTMQKRRNRFEQFCSEYESYTECKSEMARCQKEQEKSEQNRKLIREAIDKNRERIRSIESEITETEKKVVECRDKYSRYIEYQEVDVSLDIMIPKEAKEQEIRFEAITSKMSMQVQDLEIQLQKTLASLNKAVKEIERLAQKYHLGQDDWSEMTYQEKEETHQEILLEDRKNKFKLKDRQWNEEDKQIAVCRNTIENQKRDMLEKCGKEEPLSREEIKSTEFASAMNQTKFKLESVQNEITKVEQRLIGLGENLNTLAEYADFVCKQEIVWETDFSSLDTKGMRDFQGRLLRDYRNFKDECGHKKSRLVEYLYKMMQKEAYQEDYYRKPLESMFSLTDSAALVLAQLDTTLQSYNSQMEKLEVDISLVEKEKERIVELLSDYCKEVHKNLGQIDNNSTITIREKSVKMLKLQLPDWSQQEGMYLLKLQDFLEELTTRGVEILEKNENPQEFFGTRITTKNLYDSIVGTGNVQMKLYKVEAQREYPITWAQAAKNSGGEGFLTAFVILSSLLYYMRRDETDIFADRNEGKVLVMDNPFAQTNAAHLLKPLMDMADKMNTQLICFSGLGGESIYGRFDNIYVLNLVASSLRGGMQYLRGEHLRGTEEETLVSTQFEVIGQQSLLF